MKTVAVVGSTGSIGTQALEVLADAEDSQENDFDVVALAAGSRVDQLIEQAIRFKPRYLAIGDETKLERLQGALDCSIEILSGPNALAEIAEIADVTINAVMGFAGLPVTLQCLNAGKRLALANKESLVAAGPVVQAARQTPGAELLPVDSEHVALHQCLRSNEQTRRVDSLQLTASGGPFRGRGIAELAEADRSDALAHPTWAMGPKITVDSSTLMNKGLEVIEAYELFGAPAGLAGVGIGYDDIEVVVHPQSLVHSMVTFSDGSTIAQLSNPTMKLPIGYGLVYPDRMPLPYGKIDWAQLSRLDFESPDRETFPCLDIAYDAGRAGGCAPAWLSAANEVTVEAFLNDYIKWVDIGPIIRTAMDAYDPVDADTLDAVLLADASARRFTEQLLN